MRYSRQEALSIIPRNSQKKIENKKIVIVGCGGVGSVLAELLVRSGFLNLTLIDSDIVDETNLQRQIFEEKDLGINKVRALEKRLKNINSKVKIRYKIDLVTKENSSLIFEDENLIVDATDNFEARILINSYCEKKSKDWLYTGAVETRVMLCLFNGRKKLFSKIFPKKVINESCCEVGVLASTTFLCASLALNEVIKYFLEEKEETKLVSYDIWKQKLSTINLE